MTRTLSLLLATLAAATPRIPAQARPEPPALGAPGTDYTKARIELIRKEQSATDASNNRWEWFVETVNQCAGFLEGSIEISDEYAAYKKADPDMRTTMDGYLAITGRLKAPELAGRAESVLRGFVRTSLARRLDALGEEEEGRIFVPPIPSEKLDMGWRFSVSPLRNVVFACEARIVLAVRDNDLTEFKRAIRNAMTITSIACYDSGLTAMYCADVRARVIREVLDIRDLPRGFAAAVVEEFSAGRLPRWELGWECDRLSAFHDMDWAFRQGIDDLLAAPWPGNLVSQVMFASRLEQFEALDAMYAGLLCTFETDAAKRSAADDRSDRAFTLMDSKWFGIRRYQPADMMSLAVSRISRKAKERRMEFEGAIASFAVLAYKEDQGSWPQNLQELCPKYLKDVPRDWYGEKRGHDPLRYRKIDPTQDPEGREFLIYSVALDGQDNQGREPKGIAGEANYPYAAGTDFVVSRRHETPE